MRSALEWAQVRALAADGISQREIAQRPEINRRTVARLLASDEPPRYRVGCQNNRARIDRVRPKDRPAYPGRGNGGAGACSATICGNGPNAAPAPGEREGFSLCSMH